MNDHKVDADKICKHIKYTRHWLDKANTDFTEQRFAEGSVLLNIARAELTAAWEEVIQLKTQVTKTLPRKAKDHWKPLTSVGLLAAGFMISVFVTRLTTINMPGTDSRAISSPKSDVMLVREQATAPAKETVQPYQAPMTEKQTTETGSAPAKQETEKTVVFAANKTTTKTQKKRSYIFTDKTETAAAPAAPAAIENNAAATEAPAAVETAAAPAEQAPSPAAVEAPAQKERKTQLQQTEVIDLFSAARKALHK